MGKAEAPVDPKGVFDTLTVLGSTPMQAILHLWKLDDPSCRDEAISRSVMWVRGESRRGATALLQAFRTLLELDASLGNQSIQAAKGLAIHDDLDIRRIPGLSVLPERLEVRGSLLIEECPDFKSLQGSVDVEGQVFLLRCAALTEVEPGLRTDTLFISWCKSLVRLPNALTTLRRLHVDGCSALRALPENLHIRNGNFGDCHNLESAGQGLRAEQSLSFTRCTSLTQLPPGASIGGHLLLADLPGLVALPDGLEVGGDLTLARCPSWNGQIPKDARIGGRIVTDADSPQGISDGRNWIVGVSLAEWLWKETALNQQIPASVLRTIERPA